MPRPPFRPLLWFLLAAAGAIAMPSRATAHGSDENYVFLNIREDLIDGAFEFAFEDLEEKMGVQLDLELDYAGQAAAAAPVVHDYIRRKFAIIPPGASPYEIVFTEAGVFDSGHHHFAQYQFRIDSGPVPDELVIVHEMCFEDDPLHRSVICVPFNSKGGGEMGAEYQALVMTPGNTRQTLNLVDLSQPWGGKKIARAGMLRFFTNPLHVLFVAGILLPAVLVRRLPGRPPVPDLRTAVLRWFGGLAAFNIPLVAVYLVAGFGSWAIPAVLVTILAGLILVVLGIDTLTGRLGPAIIALIVVAGLCHGLLLAEHLGSLAFRLTILKKAVLALLLGFMVSQAVLVAIFAPTLFLLRKSGAYVPVLVRGGSALLIAGAVAWTVHAVTASA